MTREGFSPGNRVHPTEAPMKHFRMLAQVIFESSYQHDGLEWRVTWRNVITVRNRIC